MLHWPKASKPEPVTEENFTPWASSPGNRIPDAVVINLGTNDHLGTKPSPKSAAYMKRYEALIVATAKAYGNDTRFFLACGPMSTDYCSEVKWVLGRANALGIETYLLDQRGFENGRYGKDCAFGHPSSRIDVAMARNGSGFIKATMGW